MSRKDFQLIADTLKSRKPGNREILALTQWSKMVNAFADNLASTNPRFNRDLFVRACQ